MRAASILLREALLALIATKPLDKVTVVELCRTAHVNRTTYYHHYYLIEEVLDEIIDEIIDDFQAIFDEQLSRDAVVSDDSALRYALVFQRHAGVLRIILSGQDAWRFTTRYQQFYEAAYQRYQYGGEVPDVDVSYAKDFILAGTLAVYHRWVLGAARSRPRRSPAWWHRSRRLADTTRSQRSVR